MLLMYQGGGITVDVIILLQMGGGGNPFLALGFVRLKYLNNSNIFVIFVLSKMPDKTI